MQSVRTGVFTLTISMPVMFGAPTTDDDATTRLLRRVTDQDGAPRADDEVEDLPNGRRADRPSSLGTKTESDATLDVVVPDPVADTPWIELISSAKGFDPRSVQIPMGRVEDTDLGPVRLGRSKA